VVQRGWRSGQATRKTYSRSAPPDQSARSARRACPLKRTALLAKPVNGINAPQRPDCVAGHVRLELRDVVANYPFESSRGFPRSEPNSGHGDHSRLSCGLAETQLRSARILVASITRLLAALIAPTALWPAPACVHHGRAPHMSWGRRPRHQDKIHTLRISRRRSSSLFVQDSERARIAIDRHTECFRHAGRR